MPISTVGKTCFGDQECNGPGARCLTTWPEGYCLQDCVEGACPGDGVCVGASSCFDGCFTADDCRLGYECVTVDGAGSCSPP